MENLLDVKGASELLGISIFTIHKWLGQGKIPSVRLGRRVLFDPQDLEKWVEGNKVAVRN
jgi:excisionase family DNA binding protein